MTKTKNVSSRVRQEIIPNHLIANRDQYRRLIESHFSCVSPKAVNQMRRALDQPSNRFWTDIIGPNLFVDAQGCRSDEIQFIGGSDTPLVERPIYFPISNSLKTYGRNHKLAGKAFEADPAKAQNDAWLFANALRVGFQDDHGDWERPMLRVVGASYTIFTLEYDADSQWEPDRRLQFLDTQLGWFRKVGSNDLDRPIRSVWEWAAQFSDFRGICANWGGNKSVHIHLVFDTSALMCEHPQLRDQMREAYMRLWNEMSTEIVKVFPQEIEPDASLAQPEQYRKLPNGRFVVEKPTHLLGIPVGTEVPLLCLWEKLLDRAPVGANRAFVNEGILKQTVCASGPRKSLYRSASKIGDMTGDEHQYCSDQFNLFISKLVGPGNYPMGAGLHKESVWIGRLLANQFDRNPSTIILENSRRTYVQGGKHPDRVVELPYPLWFFIRKWRHEYAQQNGLPLPVLAVRPVVKIATNFRPEEEKFRAAATSSELARRELESMLPDLIKQHARILLRAPEGLGKTTAVARAMPDLIKYLTHAALAAIPLDSVPRRDAEWQRPSVFALSSYDLAKEKAEEFNASAAGARLRGIVFPSFSRLYGECCDTLGESVLTPTIAAQSGAKSLVAEIKSRQPGVWDEMARRHSRLHQTSGVPKRVVYFVVHQVLQQAATNLLTAAFLHPSFFDVESGEWWRLKEEMRFQIAVHDEIPVEAIVTMHPADQVEWCLDLFEAVPDIWDGEDAGLAKKLKVFRAKRRADPIQIKFAEVLDIRRAEYRREDQTEVAGCEPYGDGLLYSGTHGHRWFSRKRSWWNGLADRTILLTTEALPTEMIRTLSPDEGQFEVFDLMTELRSGSIQVRLFPSCSSENAEEIVQQIRQDVEDPDLQVITNRAPNAEGTSTHAGMRGSNRLTGQTLAQTAFFKSPSEYERLQIINRLFGLSAAIRLRHVDEINQSAGRNLGFRHDGKVEHHLVMGWSLYEEIEQVLYGECRYQLTLIEDTKRRKRNKFNRQRGKNRALADHEIQIAALWGDETQAVTFAQLDVGSDANSVDPEEWQYTAVPSTRPELIQAPLTAGGS